MWFLTVYQYTGIRYKPKDLIEVVLCLSPKQWILWHLTSQASFIPILPHHGTAHNRLELTLTASPVGTFPRASPILFSHTPNFRI